MGTAQGQLEPGWLREGQGRQRLACHPRLRVCRKSLGVPLAWLAKVGVPGREGGREGLPGLSHGAAARKVGSLSRTAQASDLGFLQASCSCGNLLRESLISHVRGPVRPLLGSRSVCSWGEGDLPLAVPASVGRPAHPPPAASALPLGLCLNAPPSGFQAAGQAGEQELESLVLKLSILKDFLSSIEKKVSGWVDGGSWLLSQPVLARGWPCWGQRGLSSGAGWGAVRVGLDTVGLTFPPLWPLQALKALQDMSSSPQPGPAQPSSRKAKSIPVQAFEVSPSPPTPGLCERAAALLLGRPGLPAGRPL